MTSPIPLEKFDEGIRESIDNATKFLNDAVFLHQDKRYRTSILLSILSFEESGKALLLMDYKSKKNEITKSQWIKKFCNHSKKNIASIVAIWKDAGFDYVIPNIRLGNLQQERKNASIYVDYDFMNKRWLKPDSPASIEIKGAEEYSSSTISNASTALKCLTRRLADFDNFKKSEK